MKAVIVVDIPENFKNSFVDVDLDFSEGTTCYSISKRALSLGIMPEKEEIYERIYQAYGLGKDDVYRTFRDEFEKILDEIFFKGSL